MPEATLEQATCENCDAPVRENTLFCYNCGSRVAEDPVIETRPAVDSNGFDAERQAALDDLAERFKIDEASDDKLAQAAEERRKARVIRHKEKEYVWEPKDSSSSLILILAVIITAITACIVFFTVFWK